MFNDDRVRKLPSKLRDQAIRDPVEVLCRLPLLVRHPNGAGIIRRLHRRSQLARGDHPPQVGRQRTQHRLTNSDNIAFSAARGQVPAQAASPGEASPDTQPSSGREASPDTQPSRRGSEPGHPAFPANTDTFSVASRPRRARVIGPGTGADGSPTVAAGDQSRQPTAKAMWTCSNPARPRPSPRRARFSARQGAWAPGFGPPRGVSHADNRGRHWCPTSTSHGPSISDRRGFGGDRS